MITVKIGQQFPITVSLIDETEEGLSSGQTVYYDIRSFPSDLPLTPTKSGILIESVVEPGIYNGEASIDSSGNYIIYATCSGFLPNVENLTVEDDELSDLIKQNRHYNISVEDVIRETQSPTPSQEIRKVPEGKTDYVVTRIKRDEDLDWSGINVASSTLYAWYRENTDQVPYRVGESGV